ncbi:MAG TPA: nucleotidyltransferase family protein [Blastocatellia bacterium]|nr:nucleotidyltransferase family protein [Blastocatellia bacterium]
MKTARAIKQNESTGRLVARVLCGAWRRSPEPLDVTEQELELISPQLLVSGAAGLVWSRARLSDLKQSPVAATLRQAYRFQALQSELQAKETARIFADLRSAGVEPVLLKGWATARSYAENGLRPSGDIDLLIQPSQAAAATEIIKSNPPAEFNVDLRHREFDQLDSNAVEELWSRSTLVEPGIRVLGAEDHLAFICLHMLRHGAWRPLWLCDIAAQLESRPADFDWTLCLGGSRQSGWIACAIELAHRMIGARVSDTPMASSATSPPAWLVREVLKQWANPDPRERMALDYREPFAKSLVRPSRMAAEVRARWPNPIQATIRVGGPLNQLPRLPFQIGDGLVRLTKLVSSAGGGRRQGRSGTTAPTILSRRGAEPDTES